MLRTPCASVFVFGVAAPATTMKKLIAGLFGLFKFLMFLCMTGMVVLVFSNVVMRYVWHSGVPESEELARVLFVWMTFLGATVALREHGHLSVHAVLARLSPHVRRGALVCGHLLMLWVCWLIVSGAWQQTRINWPVASSATGLPLGLFDAAGLFFGLSAGAVLLVQLIDLLRGKDHHALADTARPTPPSAASS